MRTIQDKINQLHQTIATAQADVDTLSRQLCQIGGTLFNDTDADGSRDHGETLTGVRKILLQPGDILAASDAAGNYLIGNLDPGIYHVTRPDFPAGYRLSNPTAPGGDAIIITLAAGEHQTVDIGTTNRVATPQTAAPVAPPVATAPVVTAPVATAPVPTAPVATAPVAIAPVTVAESSPIAFAQVAAATSDDLAAARWPAIGACMTLTTDAKDEPSAIATVAKATTLGLSHLRSFGPCCRTGGGLDAGYINAVRRLTSRGLRVVVLHGAPQGDPAHTTYAEPDWQRFFAAVAAARNGNDLYEIELQNELNLTDYWPLGGGGALSTAAVTKMIAIVKIARAALGPAATIIGPSIGWNAGAGPHLSYQKAMLDAGLLDYVTAINTHLYFSSPQQVADVLGQYRQWIGPARKMYLTEINCPAKLAGFAQSATGFVDAVHQAAAIPMIYRLTPRGNSSWDDRCLFTAAGEKNAAVAEAWLQNRNAGNPAASISA